MAEGKWINGLHAAMPAVDAARLVLAARFEVVRQYLPLAAERPYDDPEYVHQLRVGTRRAGAALRAFADFLPRKHLTGAKDYLRALRQAAGDARDWDVFLAGLGGSPADGAQPARDFLLGYVLGGRAAAQVRLVEAAAAAGPAAADMATLPARVRRPKGDDVPRTFGDLAAAHLGSLFHDLAAAVEANPDDPHALHRLRIEAKRVRYATEIFAACFAPPLKAVLYPAVEEVQEILGRLQDAAVGTGRLERFREVARQATPDDWARLGPGLEGLVGDLRETVPVGREQFRGWRAEWARLTAEHPLESLRLIPAGPVTAPATARPAG